MKVLVCIGLAGQFRSNPGQSIPTGQFLESYDPEFREGSGLAMWTADPSKAMKFESAKEALELWQQVPKSRPIRNDGRPNRPLTAYTVEVVEEV